MSRFEHPDDNLHEALGSLGRALREAFVTLVEHEELLREVRADEVHIKSGRPMCQEMNNAAVDFIDQWRNMADEFEELGMCNE